MNKQLIRDLAITGGIYDCICDPNDNVWLVSDAQITEMLENGDHHSIRCEIFRQRVMIDLERFAQLIVAECTAVLFAESEKLFELCSEENNMRTAEEYEICSNQCVHDIELIEKHFEVEE